MMTDDMDLLREYARNHSEEAFAALVSRHIHLVYSVALRHVHDAHLAAEVTQATFIILARKAGSLSPRTILPGWLCRTARYVAVRALTVERRRQIREQEAYVQTVSNDSPESVWTQIEPLLETALAQLGKRDHDAIVLRFFQNKSLYEVGTALGASEEAAKKRVNRALEKLRKYFAKRGVVLTSVLIAGTVSANSIHAAPATLAKAVTAVAVANGAAASISTLTLIKGALKLMAWSKTKTTVAMSLFALIVGGAGIVTVADIREHKKIHQIATDLLAMHHDWASYGYHARPLPKNLAGPGNVHAWSAGILGAYVQYTYKQDGVEWIKMFHILRTDTNTTTWTLSEIVMPADTNLSQMAHTRTLTRVTGQP
jgi:RNA polymerase sigma factor (sigma-70 family)